MTGETPITIVGNLTADPELRQTRNGIPVVTFTVASTPRTFDRQTNEFKDGTTLFIRCSAWRAFAENIAAELRKGSGVVVVGVLEQRNYQAASGENRSSIELVVSDIGMAVRKGDQSGRGRQQQENRAADDNVPF